VAMKSGMAGKGFRRLEAASALRVAGSGDTRRA
jgi:hypothetical protein